MPKSKIIFLNLSFTISQTTAALGTMSDIPYIPYLKFSQAPSKINLSPVQAPLDP